MDKSSVQRGLLPLVFGTLSESVTEVMNIVPARSPQVEVMKVDEDGNIVMRSDSQEPLI